MEPRTFPYCFACGPDNAQGLQLVFTVEEEGRAHTTYVALDGHVGYPDIVHGGILATLVDETMAKAIQGLGETGVTAQLELHFRRPARVGQMLRVEGWVVERRGRKWQTRAQVRDEQGQIITEGHGVFVLFAEAERP